MSYLVFARKFRPQSFEDVVAQEHVTRTLQNAIKNDRVGTGYLFCGPRGTGKTTTARILAKALNCVNGPTPKPCGTCDPCKEIAAGSSLDVLEIDAASNTGVDDIRTLRENVRYLPTGGKKRIYIIDEVHRLSPSAFDALLKTLEEPPKHILFIFATTEPFRVPETILSRTQRFDFKRVSAVSLADHLGTIARKEKIQIARGALQLLARKADGSVRDSLSLLDQITAYAGNEISENDVVDALGLVDRQMLFDFTTAIAARDTKGVLEIARRAVDSGVDVGDFVAELLEHFRVLLLLVSDKSLAENEDLGADDLKAYIEQIEKFSVGDIIRLIKLASDLANDLKAGLEERLVLETTAVRMAQLERTVQLQELLTQIKAGSLATGSTADAVKKKSDPVEPRTHRRAQSTQMAPTRSIGTTPDNPSSPSAAQISPSTSAQVTTSMVQNDWEQFVGTIRSQYQMLASQLRMAEVRDVTNNRLTLVFGPRGSAALAFVKRASNGDIVSQALRDHYRADLRLNLEFDVNLEEPEEPPESHQDITAQLLAKSDRLKKLVKIFDGEILEVRKVRD